MTFLSPMLTRICCGLPSSWRGRRSACRLQLRPHRLALVAWLAAWAWGGELSRAHARNVDPGAVAISAQVGPSLRLDTALSGTRTYALFGGEIDYAFDKHVSCLADLNVGGGGATPLRFHVGGRLRMADVGVPLVPFVQAQFGVGWLFDVLGADLTYFGVRIGGGLDYALTERWSVGTLVAFDLGGTTASRSAFFGTLDAVAYGRLTL